MSDVPNVPVPVWDVPLDRRGPPALSPADWRARNDAALARKVAVIAAAARDPSGSAREELPTNHKELRAWSDPERRLWPWAGREVDDKNGRNREIVAQLHKAWRALADADTRRNRAPRKLGLQKRLEAALKEKYALEAQVVRLLREHNGRGPVPEQDRR